MEPFVPVVLVWPRAAVSCPALLPAWERAGYSEPEEEDTAPDAAGWHSTGMCTGQFRENRCTSVHPWQKAGLTVMFCYIPVTLAGGSSVRCCAQTGLQRCAGAVPCCLPWSAMGALTCF